MNHGKQIACNQGKAVILMDTVYKIPRRAKLKIRCPQLAVAASLPTAGLQLKWAVSLFQVTGFIYNFGNF